MADFALLKTSAMLAVPLWQAAGAAAIIVILCGVAIFRSRFSRATIAVAAVCFVLMAIAVGSVFLERSAVNEKSAERRSLSDRVAGLTAQSLLPGSSLACLEGDIGEAVETACERVVFARPDTVASAIAYTGARLSLIVDGLEYARRSEPGFAATLNGMRRAIELDRYGLAAQVLATRDGCTAEQCPFFALARDTTALKANMTARAFDTYVARYAAGWTEEKAVPAETPKPAEPVPAPQASLNEPPAPRVVDSKYKFPSAASIPPVSIMNPEPPLPPEVKASAEPGEATDKQATKLPIPPKRPQSQAAAPPAQ